MGKFTELKVWEKARLLAVHIYKMTDANKFLKDYSLRDQMRRAAVSIASNIAEGDELGSNKQAVKFFFIAKGSTAELMTQLIIACDINYISASDCSKHTKTCEEISKMLNRLIAYRSQNKK